MNEIVLAKGNGNGTHRTNGNSANGHSVNGSHEQARELTEVFLALARELLTVDDAAADLPLRQLRVCMLLHHAPRSMSALSRELGVSQSAMTQIADRLERSRLVKRAFEDGDRRVRSLQLTSRGERMMELREQARIQRAAGIVEKMTKQTRDEVLSALNLLLSACSEPRETTTEKL